MRNKYRSKVHNKKGDRKYFTNTADKTHYKNIQPFPLRGGIRL